MFCAVTTISGAVDEIDNSGVFKRAAHDADASNAFILDNAEMTVAYALADWAI